MVLYIDDSSSVIRAHMPSALFSLKTPQEGDLIEVIGDMKTAIKTPLKSTLCERDNYIECRG